MTQLELFEGLHPVKKWLHVWTDAERERNKVVHAVKRPYLTCMPLAHQETNQAGYIRNT